MATKRKQDPKRAEPTEVVTELDLISIETQRRGVSELSKQLNKAKADLEKAELAVMDKLKGGAAVQGKLTAIVEKELGASRPSWRDLHVTHMTKEHNLTEKEVEAAAKAAYPPKEKEVLTIGTKPATV